jgi:hypothetical protein
MVVPMDGPVCDTADRISAVEQEARRLLAQHSHFRGRAAAFQYEYREDVLVVRGCVPSFYLKQVLQTALKPIDGVAWIDNQVNVVSSYGLSSIRSSGFDQ